MNIFFNENARRKITEANINYYSEPFVHPRRKMQEHDFIYLLQGEWKIGQNGENYTLTEDTVLILGANQTHYGISHCEPHTKTMYFHVTAAEGDGLFSDGEGIRLSCLTRMGDKNRIKKIFFGIVTAKLSGEERRASVLFDLLLGELRAVASTTSDSLVAEKLRNIIHQNPERFLSNAELADSVNVSVKTAENKFKSAYGITIHQYILNYKIEQAISYFKVFPELSVKSVAYNLGFYDEYHFSKQFKKITGLSPSAYKRAK